MKKLFFVSLFVAMSLACLVCTSCSGGGGGGGGASSSGSAKVSLPGSIDNALVGTWEPSRKKALADAIDILTLTFKNDGTMVNNLGESESWSTDNGKLYLSGTEQGITYTMNMPYTIDGTKLTIDYSQIVIECSNKDAGELNAYLYKSAYTSTPWYYTKK